MEHFSEISNRDDPTNPVKEDKIVESEEIEEIDLGRSPEQEGKGVMKRTKPWKVAAVDEMCP